MNLQEHIRKVLREEKKIPAYILRRLNFSNISDDMKKNSLRMFKKGVSLNSAIIEGAVFTTGEIIPWHDTEGREYEHYVYIDWVRIFEEYLIENYGKETEEYLLKVLPEDSFSNDGNKYVFWKHSEINGGNGFSDTFNSWGDLILNYGWKFPLNWWEIKSELDNISEGRKIILRPGDKHNNLGYHFSIIKKKSNIQETIRRVLREDLEKETIFILRRINQPGFVNKLELLVYDIVDTLNPCEYATAFNFFYQVMEVVVYHFVNDFIEFYDLDVLNDWLPTERVVKFIVKEKYEDFIRHTFEGRVCR